MSWLAHLKGLLVWHGLKQPQKRRVYVHDKRPRDLIMRDCKRGTPEAPGRVRD